MTEMVPEMTRECREMRKEYKRMTFYSTFPA